MRKFALLVTILLFAQPALAEEPGVSVTDPDFDEESGLSAEQPFVTFDEAESGLDQEPEIELDPVSKRFLLMDTDETGAVSREEYIDAALIRAAERFDKIDADGDGEATPDEYRTFRRSNREWWTQRFRMEIQPQTGE